MSPSSAVTEAGWLRVSSELAITMSDPQVWPAIGLALLLGAGCLLFGTWMARTVGLLTRDAPTGETLGVGLASGLTVLAVWWAAIWSGGRSSFTPVAFGFAIALALGLQRRVRRRATATGSGAVAEEDDPAKASPNHRRSLLAASLVGSAFIVAAALLYGATMAPSPHDGVQLIDHPDEAYYAVLGRDLATTGTETSLSPSGFSDLPGLPVQTWYHWGELWLAAGVITVFGTAPMAARYFVVLPLLLLAAAALTGTFVRLFAGTGSRLAFLFGSVICLFLAPVALLPGPAMSAWAAGLVFGITTYGLAAVAVLLSLCVVVMLNSREPSWSLAVFVGSGFGLILPAHIVIAGLALAGVTCAGGIRIVRSLAETGHLPVVSPIWQQTYITTAVAVAVSVVWALVTGHGVQTTPPLPAVSPFNSMWWDTVAIMALGAGIFLSIPVAWFLDRRGAPLSASIYLGTMALVAAGAIVWGVGLADFNMYYAFFAAIAVLATPVAGAATWMLLVRVQAARRRGVRLALVALCVVQLEWGAAVGVVRLSQYGPLGRDAPVPVDLLAAIQQLPPDARLAYACLSREEVTFDESQLIGIDARAGHHVVPMCFIPETEAALRGGTSSPLTPSVDWAWAPQRELYPDASAHPALATVAAFLKAHGVDYIYVDAEHPNTLVPDAAPIARYGDAVVLRVP